MRDIDTIVVHCADTPATMDIGVKEIRDWHVNGNKWNDIGYHFVIRRDGTVEEGRDISVIGSHVYGHNKKSIGICLVGGKPIKDQKLSIDMYTIDQLESLEKLIDELKDKLNNKKINVLGHCDLDSNKTCPNFNVREWLKQVKHIKGESNEE